MVISTLVPTETTTTAPAAATFDHFAQIVHSLAHLSLSGQCPIGQPAD